jgi:hypothetical protein
MIACGHGRSYGMTTCVLGRWLPGIAPCGLWDQLAGRPPVPTTALVTDIGNDLVYGAGVARTAQWVERCLRRLWIVCERIAVTELPVASLLRLGPRRFRVLRRLLFPGSLLTYGQAREQVVELNERVVQLAAAYGATRYRPRASWYGLDPIHLRRRCWAQAWPGMLSACSGRSDVVAGRGSWQRFLYLRRQRPLYRRWFGIDQHRAQPVCRWNDGSWLSLY